MHGKMKIDESMRMKS